MTPFDGITKGGAPGDALSGILRMTRKLCSVQVKCDGYPECAHTSCWMPERLAARISEFESANARAIALIPQLAELWERLVEVREQKPGALSLTILQAMSAIEAAARGKGEERR